MNKFSFDTVKEFDNHISSSILGYDMLHALIINISSFFIKEGVVPIDLGCTSGKLISAINQRYKCNAIGYDITDRHFIDGLDLRREDISSDEFKIQNTNLIYSIFTLQFIDFNKRLCILKKAYDALNKNGALIICEKEMSKYGIIQEIFTFSNYQYKSENFSPIEILEKEQGLRSVMNCVESSDNIDLFAKAGFRTIEPFFQSLNYKGYICKK